MNGDATRDLKSQISELLAASFKFQKFIFYGMGIVSAITGIVIILLLFAIPPKPGEETVVAILQGVSVVFILFGFWSVWYVKTRIRKVVALIFEHPQGVAVIKPFQVRKQGIVAYAIRLYSKDNKMIGFNVIGPKTQQKLVTLLSKQLPDAKVED